MRATVLLSTSALLLFGCGKSVNVELTARLVMSGVPTDWCGAGDKDQIRLDCPFELGLYALDVSNDAGPPVVKKTVCITMDADPNRKWKSLSEALNQTMMAQLGPIQEGLVRIEIAGVEPKAGKKCEYQESVDNASFYGRSDVLPLMGTDLPNRFDIRTKCLKAFTPTAMCMQ